MSNDRAVAFNAATLQRLGLAERLPDVPWAGHRYQTPTVEVTA